MSWLAGGSSFRIAVVKKYPMEKRRRDTVSYTRYIKTYCTSESHHRSVSTCTDELDKGVRTFIAIVLRKSQQSSRCILSEGAILSGRRSAFNRRLTTPFVDLHIWRPLDWRVEVWICSEHCLTV